MSQIDLLRFLKCTQFSSWDLQTNKENHCFSSTLNLSKENLHTLRTWRISCFHCEVNQNNRGYLGARRAVIPPYTGF